MLLTSISGKPTLCCLSIRSIILSRVASFSDFINQVVPNRTRETLFLVLTKSGGRSKIETDEKVKQGVADSTTKEFDQRIEFCM